MFISNGIISSIINDKRYEFDFDIVNVAFLNGDVPRRRSYGIYISQHIKFTRVFGHVTAQNHQTDVKLPNFSIRVIVIKHFDDFCPKSITKMMNWLQKSISD